MKAFIYSLIACLYVGYSFASPTQGEPVFNSGYDKSVWQVKEYLKKNLKDPKSFEAITWGDVQKLSATQYLVYLKYRAKNSFGGYSIESKTFYINADGDVYNVKDGMHFTPPKNKTAPKVATVKFLTYDCRVVEQGDLFIRIITPQRLSISELKKGFSSFDLNSQILYVCESGRTRRGEEYAQISKMGITYDLDKEKCKFEPLK